MSTFLSNNQTSLEPCNAIYLTIANITKYSKSPKLTYMALELRPHFVMPQTCVWRSMSSFISIL